MKRAKEEAQYIPAYDYLVINDQLEVCVDELHELIQKQHNRTSENKTFIQSIQNELSIY
jgi:guanylate kinase